jgi:putative molybdopterin biosynthesis protein
MTKEMMSVKEVAEYLNINEKLVYRLVNEKKLPGTRLTGKWTFPKRLLDEWIIEKARETVTLGGKGLEPQGHVVLIGSNDFIIELLSYELTRKFPEYTLSFSNVGSVGGLIALGKGCGHIAGCHLLDPETGQYNFPYLARYLPNIETTLINLVYRDIGLIVKAGNPHRISRIKDLINPGIKIVNRQPGSGTRVLLDFQMGKLGIDPKAVEGYDKEVTTHMQVAMAVLSGSADVGLGICAAARMLGLEFVQLTRERYDLVIRKEELSDPRIAALLEVIRSAKFKESIREMGGYDTGDTGKVMTAS